MNPVELFKCMSDETRLCCLLLIENENELCVCELTDALDVSQPKVSRHLASLRNCGLVQTRKLDQWVYYRVNLELPDWVKTIIQDTRIANAEFLKPCLVRLEKSQNRPYC